MTGRKSGISEQLEAKIQALLDGELDAAASAELKAAAEQDSVLAQAIVDAWRLHRQLDGLRPERAPASLRQKLKRIPAEQKKLQKPNNRGWPRWVLAGSLASVSLLVVMMVMSGPNRSPVDASRQQTTLVSSDEQRALETARELEIAFHYLDKVGLRVGKQINEVLSDEISTPLKDNFSKYMPYTGQSKKEKHA